MLWRPKRGSLKLPHIDLSNISQLSQTRLPSGAQTAPITGVMSPTGSGALRKFSAGNLPSTVSEVTNQPTPGSSQSKDNKALVVDVNDTVIGGKGHKCDEKGT